MQRILPFKFELVEKRKHKLKRTVADKAIHESVISMIKRKKIITRLDSFESFFRLTALSNWFEFFLKND